MSLVLTGLSMRCPLGHDPEQSCAAIRAGIHGLIEHPYFLVETPDPEWDEDEPLLGGFVPGLDPFVTGRARLVELALPALRSLCKRASLLRADLARTALIVSVPAGDGAVGKWHLDVAFAEDLCRRAGLPGFTPTLVDQSGHASMLRALAEAGRLIDEKQADRCIVLGVDSYHDMGRLAALDKEFRLRSDRTKDGFLPSEAVVALLVEKSGATGGRTPLLGLGSSAFGTEPRTIRGELSSSGAGLCQAIEGALGDRTARWVLCDLNGESYRAFEWGVARTRLAERFGAPLRLVHPADCVGDVGVVSGGVLVACAAQAFARGYAPAEHALLWTAADEGLRAAMIVSQVV